MKTTKIRLTSIAITLCSILQFYAQGYIVPNGVVYSGYTPGIGYNIDVAHDPTNLTYTGFALRPEGRTPPGALYLNTFFFNPIVDVSVRVFLVGSNQPVSLSPILMNNYTELGNTPSHVFDSGVPFYVGLYTGNQNFYPPDGIYNDPLFGWARLVNNQGVIQLLDSALVYKAEGIFAGTQTIIPEPSGIALTVLGMLALAFRRLKRSFSLTPPPARRVCP